MKTVLKLLLLVALIAYLGFAFTNLTQKENKTLCTALNYTIADSTHAGFITGDEADRLLRKAKLYPIGKAMHQINSETIEMALKQNQFIDSVACYKAPNGTVNILIVQRLPLMRIISNNGEDYYLDSRGRKLKPAGYVADMVVATGNISSKFAQQHLVAMGRFLRDDAFWNNQIEQINVLPNEHLQLVPRVGNHIIDFGNANNISTKFRNLYTFYEKVLPQVGWNKYREISVEHTSQIVGRKGTPRKHS